MLLLSLALALTPEQADDRIRSMADLEVEPSLFRYVDEPLVFERGAMALTITDGVLVPVFSGHFAGEWDRDAKRLLRRLREGDPDAQLPGPEDRGDRELVGFVWLDGAAELNVTFPKKSDAMELATRQVMHAGADRDTMREVARQRQPFATTASEGVFLSADAALDALFLGGDADADPYEIVVYDRRPTLVGARARELMDARLSLWESQNLDWSTVVAEDRLLASRAEGTKPSWLVDVHTADRYARVSEQPTRQDQWLALVDGHGHITEGWSSEIMAAGTTPQGWGRAIRISGEPMPPSDPDDPTSAPRSGLSLEPVHADVRLMVDPRRGELFMHAEIAERLRFRATEPVSFAWIEVPRVEAKPQSFEWVVASLPDGRVLARPEQVGRESSEVEINEPEPKPKPKEKQRDKEKKWQRLDELEQARQRVRIVFPEPILPGEEVDIDLQWKDTWPAASIAFINGVTTAQNLGSSTGLQQFLPYLDGRYPSWDYELSVGLPVDSAFSAAVSGPVQQEEDVDGWHWVHTSEVPNARYPNVVIGKYDHRSFPGKKGLPRVHVYLQNADKKQLQDMAIEARAAIAYMARYLPPYTFGEYDIVEAPSAVDHYTWVAPHGMQVMQRMLRTQVGRSRDDQGRATFAHEVAHQWWGQMAQPASLDDRWMIETFAEVFSCMYVAKANENVEPCADVLEENRKLAEGNEWWADIRASASLEEAFVGGNRGKVVYQLGPYVMLNMLRPRVGTEAFFGALSTMLAEHPHEPVTNARLKAYMERTSGQDLDDFFDYWVHQGIIPEVQLTWSHTPTVVSLEVTSDVPFGTFDIPVVIQGDYGKQVVAVTVRDGVGRVEVDGDYRRTAKVTLDPAHRTLTRARSVSKR